jgi:GNAT superfamily N-acetyltransferase
MQEDTFTCTPRYFRDEAELDAWRELNRISFSSWYNPRGQGAHSLEFGRTASNADAAVFPDFFHELRDAKGRAVGYLRTAPYRWTGDIDSLTTYDHLSKTLKLRRRERFVAMAKFALWHEWLRAPARFEQHARALLEPLLAQANAVVLLSMVIDPDSRKNRLPTRLLDAAKDSARRLGLRYVAAPFRPSHFGEFKLQQRAANSPALFDTYCRSHNAEGLPVDPWLRNVVRHGARLVKPEPRSLSVTQSIASFETFRREHRPQDWYSPAPEVWECGETATWYIDQVQGSVTSWEPNCWGVFDLEDGAAEGAGLPPLPTR